MPDELIEKSSHPLDYTGDASTIHNRFVDQIFIGALVTWLHKPRGGYGYEVRVPAEVRAIHRTTGRVTIAAALNGGGIKHVVVPLLSLRWRQEP
jgi:hypothetical protein